MKYIEYISSPDGGNAKEYGIVKIVPPEGWKMDFVLDQEVCRAVALISKCRFC